MHYLLGDLQGCADALARMRAVLDFSPSRDHLYVLGDLVNRGPDNVGTLQQLADLGASATCLLGNHDLHTLAVMSGLRAPGRGDTLSDLTAPAAQARWLPWLRTQRLAVQAQGWLMVHAGLPPAWDAATALGCAAEIEAELQGPQLREFLSQLYGNEPTRWSPDLQGMARLRYAVNALTRMRFVHADTGELELHAKESAAQAPPGCVPWFEAPGRRHAGTPIAFGHWSLLGVRAQPDLLALDGGCVWGGELVAARLAPQGPELIRLPCSGRAPWR